MQAVLDKALESYRRQQFLDKCDAAYAVLQQDPDTWKEYREELQSFEGTVLDGIDPNENGASRRKAQPTEQKAREKQLA